MRPTLGLIAVTLLVVSSARAIPLPPELVLAVHDLGLGSGPFIVGGLVPDATWEDAADSRLDDAYPGTVKFESDGSVVVADATSRRVLAIYERQENAGAADVRTMVGGLMERFGEPTTMAHGNLIYWAFGPDGKIDGAAYEAAKQTGEIDILATVKFSSSLPVDPGMDDASVEGEGTIYYIIASDRLLAEYVSKP